MTALDLRNPGLRDIFRMGVRRVYAYRIFTYLGVVVILLQLLLMRAIWQAVYGDQQSVDGVPIETMVTFLTVTALLGFMLRPTISEEIHRRIDQGQVAVDMVRPVGFVRQMIALSVGEAAGRWLGLVLVVPGLLVIGSLAPPSPGALLVFLLSLIMAYVVSMLIWLLVGLSGFWLIDASGMKSIVGVVGSFLGGSTIPLWFMPEPLRIVVELLPFQAIFFLPASIYVEQAQALEMWRALGIQAFWVVALWLVAAWTWRRAQNRLVVQGG
ncbi:MAG: ABC transporter permease [Thermomicrobiales bacterium]